MQPVPNKPCAKSQSVICHFQPVKPDGVNGALHGQGKWKAAIIQFGCIIILCAACIQQQAVKLYALHTQLIQFIRQNGSCQYRVFLQVLHMQAVVRSFKIKQFLGFIKSIIAGKAMQLAIGAAAANRCYRLLCYKVGDMLQDIFHENRIMLQS